MPEITITIPDDVYEELKAEATERGVSVDAVAQDRICLERQQKAGDYALQWMREARANADAVWPERTDDEVMELAVAVTREVRAAKERKQHSRNH